MPDDARQRLAADQASLVAALSGQAETPEGFDAARVTLAAETLVAKRRKGVARAWPRLADALGDAFSNQFGVFASQFPPHPAGPFHDGLAFARWLDRRGELPPAAVPEYVNARLWAGPPVGFFVRRDGSGVRVGLRLPGVGTRILSLPFFSR